MAPAQRTKSKARKAKPSNLLKKEKSAKAAKSIVAKQKAITESPAPQSLKLPSVKSEGKGKKTDEAPEPESQDENGELGAEEEGEEEVYLHGFSSEGEDSSDEEDGVQNAPAVEVSRLPTVAKDDETVKKKLERAKRQPTQDRGVIYLARIPHGFYEDEMKAYFAQFGDVTRLRLSRSRKTGRSKHYAFVEFSSSSVAQIVAETMDNYLLLGHILRCKLIPKDEVHPELWVGANRKWRVVPRDRISRVQQNKPRTDEQKEKAENRLLSRQEQKKRKLQETGIDYDFDAIAYKKKATSTAY